MEDIVDYPLEFSPHSTANTDSLPSFADTLMALEHEDVFGSLQFCGMSFGTSTSCIVCKHSALCLSKYHICNRCFSSLCSQTAQLIVSSYPTVSKFDKTSFDPIHLAETECQVTIIRSFLSNVRTAFFETVVLPLYKTRLALLLTDTNVDIMTRTVSNFCASGTGYSTYHTGVQDRTNRMPIFDTAENHVSVSSSSLRLQSGIRKLHTRKDSKVTIKKPTTKRVDNWNRIVLCSQCTSEMIRDDRAPICSHRRANSFKAFQNKNKLACEFCCQEAYELGYVLQTCKPCQRNMLIQSNVDGYHDIRSFFTRLDNVSDVSDTALGVVESSLVSKLDDVHTQPASNLETVHTMTVNEDSHFSSEFPHDIDTQHYVDQNSEEESEMQVQNNLQLEDDASFCAPRSQTPAALVSISNQLDTETTDDPVFSVPMFAEEVYTQSFHSDFESERLQTDQNMTVPSVTTQHFEHSQIVDASANVLGHPVSMIYHTPSPVGFVSSNNGLLSGLNSNLVESDHIESFSPTQPFEAHLPPVGICTGRCSFEHDSEGNYVTATPFIDNDICTPDKWRKCFKVPVVHLPARPEHHAHLVTACSRFVHKVHDEGLFEETRYINDIVHKQFHPSTDGKWSSFVLRPNIHDRDYHFSSSSLNKYKLMLSSCVHHSNFCSRSFTIIGGRIHSFVVDLNTSVETFWIELHPEAIILIHPKITTTIDFCFADICCGLGGFGNSLRSLRLDVGVCIDQNQHWENLATVNSCETFVATPIAHTEALIALLMNSCNAVTAGVPCQSFSIQGDRQGIKDPRGVVVLAVTRQAWLSGCSFVLLECTPTVMTDNGFQCLLDCIHQLSDFDFIQTIHDDRKCWPSTRQRWVSCMYQVQYHRNRPVFPDVHEDHSISLSSLWNAVVIDYADVHDYMLPRPAHLAQMRKDKSQTFSSRIIQNNEAMQVIPHSYTSLWTNCPCMCRMYSFSAKRLASGIRSVLVKLSDQTFRYLHPVEIRTLMACNFHLFVGRSSSEHQLATSGLGQAISLLTAQHVISVSQDFLLTVPDRFFSYGISNYFLSRELVIPVSMRRRVKLFIIDPFHNTFEHIPGQCVCIEVTCELVIRDVLLQHPRFSNFHVFAYSEELPEQTSVVLLEKTILSTVPLADIDQQMFSTAVSLASKDHIDITKFTPFYLSFTRFLSDDSDNNQDVVYWLPWSQFSVTLQTSIDRTVVDVTDFLRLHFANCSFILVSEGKILQDLYTLTSCHKSIYIHPTLLGGMYQTANTRAHLPFDVYTLAVFLRGQEFHAFLDLEVWPAGHERSFKLRVAKHMLVKDLMCYLVAQYPGYTFSIFKVVDNVYRDALSDELLCHPTTSVLTWQYSWNGYQTSSSSSTDSHSRTALPDVTVSLSKDADFIRCVTELALDNIDTTETISLLPNIAPFSGNFFYLPCGDSWFGSVFTRFQQTLSDIFHCQFTLGRSFLDDIFDVSITSICQQHLILHWSQDEQPSLTHEVPRQNYQGCFVSAAHSSNIPEVLSFDIRTDVINVLPRHSHINVDRSLFPSGPLDQDNSLEVIDFGQESQGDIVVNENIQTDETILFSSTLAPLAIEDSQTNPIHSVVTDSPRQVSNVDVSSSVLQQAFENWLETHIGPKRKQWIGLPWKKPTEYTVPASMLVSDVLLWLNTVTQSRIARVVVRNKYIFAHIVFPQHEVVHFVWRGLKGGMQVDDNESATDAWLNYKQTSTSSKRPQEQEHMPSSSSNKKITPPKAHVEELAKLFSQQGVLERHTIHQSNLTIQHLGASNIKRILQSTRPWQDLQAEAHKQDYILLPDHILKKQAPKDTRITSNFEAEIQLHDLHIRPRDFVSVSDGSFLEVIPITAVERGAQGISIATSRDAIRFVEHVGQLSDFCLSLVIPFKDSDTPFAPELALETTTYPFSHEVTGIIIVFRCYLMHLGKISAKKLVLANDMPEIPITHKLILSMHRKDTDLVWQDVLAKPMTILQSLFPSLLEDTISCFRVETPTSAILKYQLVILPQKLQEMLKFSGTNGIFISPEPGSELAALYRPIWLPRVELAEAIQRSLLDVRCLGVIKRIEKQKEVIRVSYAVRVLDSQFHELRQIITGDNNPDYISSRYRFLLSPVPPGYAKEQIFELLAPLQWKFRVLVSHSPESWILGADTEPSSLNLSYAQGDLVLHKLVSNLPPYKVVLKNRVELEKNSSQLMLQDIKSLRETVSTMENDINSLQQSRIQHLSLGRDLSETCNQHDRAILDLQSLNAQHSQHLNTVETSNQNIEREITTLRSEMSDLSLRQDAVELKADKIDVLRNELLTRMESNQEALLSKFAALIPRSKNGPY